MQVVVVGASETGLTCLEHLLLQPNMSFSSITLLAPGGICTDSLANQVTADQVARMGLQASVAIVDSHMVALDTQQQQLVLADGTQMPYDLLVVATGLQVCPVVSCSAIAFCSVDSYNNSKSTLCPLGQGLPAVTCSVPQSSHPKLVHLSCSHCCISIKHAHKVFLQSWGTLGVKDP